MYEYLLGLGATGAILNFILQTVWYYRTVHKPHKGIYSGPLNELKRKPKVVRKAPYKVEPNV